MSGLEVRGLEARIEEFRLGPVNLDAGAGGATVLLGPSGSGKTTLLRTVAGLHACAAGEVRLDGERLDGLPPERRRIGLVPPDLGLFRHRRVRRNVSYPLDLRGDPEAAAKADRWLERFELRPLAERYPEQLSSGERQRVAMARALAAEPRLLLWDEPLAALDVESRDALLRLLRELLETEQLPLVLVTHDPSVAFALAARLVVLGRGKVRFDGPPATLARGPLDRFAARFLGYDNLYRRDELDRFGDPALTSRLAAAAGPEGVVVPEEAVRWDVPSGAGTAAHVASLRWGAGGWRVGLRCGALVLYARGSGEAPGVRVGDPVRLDVDAASCRPLFAPAEDAGAP
ncbi:MAG TPA: ABC transporter ATP-binding protein [Thermoplasmata archaeon]|nr:ABC transporter ATP-binding protein [Thermoplasmata archaeon]